MLKNKKIIVLSFFIFLLSVITSLKIIAKEKEVLLSDEQINYYYEPHNVKPHTDEYIGILKIPSINLTRGFYAEDSPFNSVKHNIEVIKNDMDQILILASHRGNSQVSFFNNLNLLTIGDEIYLDYLHQEYKYRLYYKYYEKKDGNLAIKYDDTRQTLVLITCDKEDKTKQVVYVAYKI